MNPDSLKLSRVQLWHTEDGVLDHAAVFLHNPATSPDGSHFADGATADQMRSMIAEVANGLREPDAIAVETAVALIAPLHIEHLAAGLRNAAREEHKQALDAMIDDHASALAAGTGATLDDVHARAMTLRSHIRARAEHINRMVKVHTEQWRNDQFAAETAKVQAHREKLSNDLNEAINAELAPMRAEHDALTKGDTKAVIEALRAQVAQHEATIATLKAEPVQDAKAEVAQVAGAVGTGGDGARGADGAAVIDILQQEADQAGIPLEDYLVKMGLDPNEPALYRRAKGGAGGKGGTA